MPRLLPSLPRSRSLFWPAPRPRRRAVRHQAFLPAGGPETPHTGAWEEGKNMKLSNWQKNISATEYYARVRPKKIPEMLQKAMKLTDEEVETYFGEVLRLLEETNTKK